MIFAVSAGAVLAVMLAGWVASLLLRDVSIVDVLWGPAFVVVAWVAGAGTLLIAMVTVWGLRLAWHLGRRKLREPGEDPRYAEWRAKHGERFGRVSLVTVFVLQGVLVWVVSLPVQAAGSGGIGWLGAAVWAVGVAFEAVGDAQLARFKGDPANRGRVMDRGLWRYTRHPNYFGDFLVWWGIYVAAGAWWTVAGPLVMSMLLTRVSGKDHLERRMVRRPGYADYVARTSGFVPLPPRSRAS